MRLGSILIFFAAAVLAVLAGFAAESWLEQQRHPVQIVTTQLPAASMAKLVVASQPLRFGNELSTINLREIDWPAASLPVGAFGSINDLFKDGGRRVVLTAIDPNEPILQGKITGPGQRASLSSVIDPGKKAITIRVNDVFGVAGFVLPGDRVDVLMTKTANATEKADDSFTDVILQQVRVLGIDQLADEKTDKPEVVKAVTIEVATEDAERVALAGTIGSLSLALRPAGATGTDKTGRITAAMLSGDEMAFMAPDPVAVTPPARVDRCADVFVTRFATTTDTTAQVTISPSGTISSSTITGQKDNLSRTGYPVQREDDAVLCPGFGNLEAVAHEAESK